MPFKIKEARKARNMTQDELAKKSGISRATISGLETGTIKTTTTSTLIKLADALGTTVWDIFYSDCLVR